MNPEFNPRVFVISGPSGTGKSTIIHGAMERVAELRLSVSFTTRSPRPGEKDGKDYYFIEQETFEKKIEAGDFLEWARVFDNCYGTSATEVSRILAEGRHALLDVDVQGAKSIKAIAQGVTYFFIMPPSMEELATRLRNRGTESEESLGKRLAKAEFEASHAPMYDYTIVNDDAGRAIGELVQLIRKEEKAAIRFHHRGGTQQTETSTVGGADPVEKFTREVRSHLRDEMISLINNRVRTTLARDLDRLILDTFREYTRRDS